MPVYKQNNKGFSLVEVLVVSAITVLVFGALFLSFQYALTLISQSRIKVTALTLANERMESIRSLSYNAVGTEFGIPSGLIPQTSTTSLNGMLFHERVLIEYHDDPADGIGVADTNSVTTDYKRVKVEYSWNLSGATSTIALISNVVPRSIETTTGGGTVRVNAIDENALLLPGASVQLINTTLVPPINVTRFTDATGVALFSGAPAGSDYELIVTAAIGGNQYSTDQTHQVTIGNPNPLVAPFSVVESDISTLTFQIGELSDLSLETFSSMSEGVFKEEFTDLLSVASSSAVVVSGGTLQLEETAGVHETSGSVFIGPIAPASITAWQKIRVAAQIPLGTDHRVQLYTGTGSGPFTLIPDADFTGNAIGFHETIVDIAALSASTYPAIYIGVHLETTDTSVTPSVDEVSIYYRESATPLASVTMDLRGNKTIGLNALLQPIYKYEQGHTTDVSGTVLIPALEFDSYVVTPPAGYAIAMACPAHPVIQHAGIDGDVELLLVGSVSETLRVSVVDVLGRAVPGVAVQLMRSGYDTTQLTNSCGQTFFSGGLVNATDYVINISAAGYDDQQVLDFEINGNTTAPIIINEW